MVVFKKIHKDIPSYVTVRGWKTFIRYRGQPKTCRSCGKVGHFAKDCPSKRKPDERSRENQDKSKEKEKADEPTENMEVIESTVTPTVTPTHEDLVQDLLDNLAEPESDSVQVPTKVAENLDSEFASKVLTNESVSNSTVKPLGAKDSLKGDPGVTKKGKKKRKKNLNRAVLDQFEDATAAKESLVQDTVPTGMNQFGPLNWSVSFSAEKQCYVCDFCNKRWEHISNSGITRDRMEDRLKSHWECGRSYRPTIDAKPLGAKDSLRGAGVQKRKKKKKKIIQD